jgi:predicted dehydrogenase
MDCPSPETCIVEDFFKYVVEDVEPGISGRRNMRTMAMCEALVRSAKDRKPVELSDIK